MPPQHPPTTNLCIHFYTFGHYYAHPPTPPHPPLLHVECRHLTPPPRALCERYTGLDPILSSSFFSIPANETVFQNSLAVLRGKIERRRGAGGCFAVTVSCQMGMHRSVAMAERLARGVKGMGLKSSCNHLDLAKSRGLREGKLAGAKAAEKGVKEKQREKAEGRELVKENLRLRRENGRLEQENGELAREKERRTKEWMVEQREGREEVAAAAAAPRKIQHAVREPVAAGPIQYHGKPAPADAAAYRFEKPHGWVRVAALPI